MSDVTRRSLFAAGGVAAVGAATVGGWFVFHKRYPHGAYDDILAQIPDRDDAIRTGQAVLHEMPGFDAKSAAMRLRARPLTQAMTDDAAKGKLVELNGWVMPESLVLACALAAKTA
jgi:hypothetical protein